MSAEHTKADLNPYSQALDVINKRIAKLSVDEKQAESDLRSHESTDRNDLYENLRSQVAKIVQVSIEIDRAEVECATIQKRITNVTSHLVTPLNLRGWISRNQRILRRKRANLYSQREQRESKKKGLLRHLHELCKEMQSVEEMIQQYDSFDVNSRRSQLLEIRQQLASQLEESVEIAKRETIANQVLTPFLDGLRDLDSQRQNTASRLHRAIDYFNRLSSAQNARQQAMVHQECEAEFGDGRVGIVKAQLQRELEAVDRKSKKLAQRAIEVARIATQRIDKLVIDGNNLCYKGDQFIGLAALKPLVHALKHEHAIVVVFDPSIRRRLGVRHAEIEKHFDSCVDVLVVATGRKADETVLDLAEISPHTYVLSNDRFSEFIDKAAVREDRVIRCEIVDGQAFVHALKVGVCY